MTNQIIVGIAETELKVPLFAELYGYGPFLGRRNQGTRDPLYCRAISFSDGKQKNIIITCDLVVTDDELARSSRKQIAAKLNIAPEGIMFVATHTHSGPAISKGIGWGEINPEFVAHWREQVILAAQEAVNNEEAVSAFSGTVKLSQELGYNRVQADGPTDPLIRWIKFVRPDGTVKILLHNHGMHGVVFGMDMKQVSADWMGEANRLIKERKLAEMPFFIYGAAGNINTAPCCLNQCDGEPELKRIGRAYVNDLERGLSEPGTPLKLFPICAKLEKTVLPTIPFEVSEMKAALKQIPYEGHTKYLSDRLTEMIMLAERGEEFKVEPDLQVLRMGDFYVYAFPGEPFVELGFDIMNQSPGAFSIAAGVANGNCRYFPTKETFELFPDGILSENRGYGYYEIFQGCGRFMPTYKKNIGSFIVNKLLKIGNSL